MSSSATCAAPQVSSSREELFSLDAPFFHLDTLRVRPEFFVRSLRVLRQSSVSLSELSGLDSWCVPEFATNIAVWCYERAADWFRGRSAFSNAHSLGPNIVKMRKALLQNDLAFLASRTLSA